MTTSPVMTITEELLAELDALLGLNANGSLSQPLPYLSRVLLEKAAAHIRSLTERLEKAEKDAGRYRWLRANETGPAKIWELLSDDCQPPYMTLKAMHDLDDAIDDAIAQDGQNNE